MRQLALVSVLCIGTAAVAHEGVKNPAVMARMHGMKDIAADTKVLGDMAKGEIAFDDIRMKSSAGYLVKYASEITKLFEAQEDDPKSEALPAIWLNYEDFSRKAFALELAAMDLVATVETREDLQAAVKSIGQTCTACHELYRKP